MYLFKFKGISQNIIIEKQYGTGTPDGTWSVWYAYEANQVFHNKDLEIPTVINSEIILKCCQNNLPNLNPIQNPNNFVLNIFGNSLPLNRMNREVLF